MLVWVLFFGIFASFVVINNVISDQK